MDHVVRLAAALLVLAAWSGLRGRKTLFFGLGWYGSTILPLALFAAFFSDLPILAADRYAYQSVIGLFLLAGVGASKLESAERDQLELALHRLECGLFPARFESISNRCKFCCLLYIRCKRCLEVHNIFRILPTTPRLSQ